MAKGKAARGQSKQKKRSAPGRLVRSRLVRNAALLVVALAVLFLLRETVLGGAAGLMAASGWGLVFPVAAVVTFVVQWRRRRLLGFFRRWNRWLGVIAAGLFAWGVLGFLEMGGGIGRAITGYPAPVFIGVIRLSLLVITAVLLIAPRACFRLTGKTFAWLGRQFQRKPVPPAKRARELEKARLAIVAGEKPALPPEMEQPLTPPEIVRPAPGKEATPAGASAAPQQDLKQIAQEVWKKYGQSSEGKTVDGWRLPPVNILDHAVEIEFSQADNMQRARLIEEALASYGVEGKVVQINAGPTVTQFGVEPGWDRKFKEVKERDKDGNIQARQEEVARTRVKVERITSLANDLALALAASSIRIEAPVPGKSVVGIEVPNTASSMVSLRGVIETTPFQKTLTKSKLALALGKGAGGEAVAADLTKMPHLLVAGATGSGKTVCLNTIICCLLIHNTPGELRMIMIDPKRVEMTPYNGIPHLATPVIVDASKAIGALRWLAAEMDQRYQKLAAAGARNIETYNRTRQGDDKLPYLVLVIDELADLMMAGFDEVETILCRLAQLARATGIHLVVATQRPSVDVVTGLIKANFPTRISFAVTSQVDSRTILDMVGAEKLLGKGDMLFMPTEAAKPKRLQGCFLSDAEMERLVYFWGSQRKEERDKLRLDSLDRIPSGEDNTCVDPLLEQARALAQEHKQISTSFLQRRLRIGYPRAARLMEQLEEEEDKGEGEEAG
ncbi:MAG: DNA translocase FtsK [Chloroflexi bacterium]|nr:DNA translocase FtsK [Chloroflexota bacterium]